MTKVNTRTLDFAARCESCRIAAINIADVQHEIGFDATAWIFERTAIVLAFGARGAAPLRFIGLMAIPMIGMAALGTETVCINQFINKQTLRSILERRFLEE